MVGVSTVMVPHFSRLDLNKATGVDGSYPKIIKISAIVGSLMKLFNS